jgi:hypothetical protein
MMHAKKLRASDLIPGRRYITPTGKMAQLCFPKDNGISRTSFVFVYMQAYGQQDKENGFAIRADNATAIAALREA